MKRLATFLAVLVLLTILAACGSNDDSASPNPYGKRIDGGKAESYDPNQSELEKKRIIYKAFAEVTNPVAYSQPVELTAELLKDSIQTQLEVLYGMKYQRYNYVITTADVIVVGVWISSDGESSVKFMEMASNLCATTINQAAFNLKDTGKHMINFYPESPLAEVDKNPPEEDAAKFICKDPNGKDRSLLDELTKHFMLAQGTDVNNTGYKVDWDTAQVDYAGEILIDVESCQYTISNASGTYRPDSPENLGKVAEKFGDVLRKGESSIVNPAINDSTNKNQDPDRMQGKLPSKWFPRGWCES